MTDTVQSGRVVYTAYGLDLAGYSTNGSALARADRLDTGELRITVFRNHCFGRKVAGKRLLSNVVESETAVIAACLRHSQLVVDVPIDLQGLPTPGDPRFVWELTKRPVDYALAAMPPLAQRIGSYVARFLQIRRSLPVDLKGALGSTLFETYPAASLALLGLPNKKYKGAATCGQGGKWHGMPDDNSAQSKMNHRLAAILEDLTWTARISEVLSHDEFDAALCAATGVAKSDELLAEATLKKKMEQIILAKCPVRGSSVGSDHSRFSPPAGYRLLSKRPPKATLSCVHVNDDEDLVKTIAPGTDSHVVQP